MTGLTIDVWRDLGDGVFLLNVEGMLDGDTRHLVRRSVTKCLAEFPASIVVDLTGVKPTAPTAHTVFLPLHQQASAEPAVSLLLCGAYGELDRRLRRLGGALDIYPTRPEAVRAAYERQDSVRWAHQRLPVRVESVSVAGCRIADLCAEWHLHHLLRPARAVAFELVYAALGVATDDLHLTVTLRRRRLILAVRFDIGSARPAHLYRAFTQAMEQTPLGEHVGASGALRSGRTVAWWASLPLGRPPTGQLDPTG